MRLSSTRGPGSRSYDAENRMITAANTSQGTSLYTYDADGRRVRRNSGQEWWQVYGMDGELLAEYMSGSAPYIPHEEYGYRNGQMLITANNGDEGRLQRFVTYSYEGALARDPSSTELSQQMNTLASAGAQGEAQLLTAAQTLESNLINSGSYATNTLYVTALYYAYLQRGPDSGGLSWWLNDANTNGRAHTLSAFAGSSGFQTLVAGVYGTDSTDDTRAQRFVKDMYDGATGVDPTSTQMQQGVQSLDAAAAQGQAQVITAAQTMATNLGTAGMIVDKSGSLASVKRHDYLPFGEELYAGVGGRTTGQGYVGDDVRQKFTQKERDTETGLDYFGARYYSSVLGRFTGGDPIFMSHDRIFNPQEINLYSYCQNSPLDHIDPDGRYFTGTDNKRVDVSVSKDGKITVGNNASADLKRMANLVSKSGSATALSQFMKVADNDTQLNFKIADKSSGKPLFGLHQAHDEKGNALTWDDKKGVFNGDTAYITKGKKGAVVGYQEATITVYEGEIKDNLGILQRDYGDPKLTVDDALVTVFSHESDHDTDKEAINAIHDREEGIQNNNDPESSAGAVEVQTAKEIKERRPKENKKD